MSLCLHVSISPCFPVSTSMSPCLNVSMSPCPVSMSMSPCSPQTENETFRKWQLLFVCCKWKAGTAKFWLFLQMEQNGICFPWSANDKRNRQFLFQQTCPSMIIEWSSLFNKTFSSWIRVMSTRSFRHINNSIQWKYTLKYFWTSYNFFSQIKHSE